MAEPSGSTPNDMPGNNNGGGTDTVAGYLTQFGLTEEDIKPVTFTSFELGDDSVIISVSNQDDVYDWFRQVCDKTKSIARDGKLYNDMYPYTEGEHTWEEPAAGTVNCSWVYKYNGANVHVLNNI